MTLPIGDRIRQAHAEHVAAVDPWEGADSIETKVWKPPLIGGVQTYVAGEAPNLELLWDSVARAFVIGGGTG